MKKLSKIKMARTAKLYNCGGDLRKQWFVYFSYRNPRTGKLERIRISEGLAQYKTVEERTAYAEKMIADINQKLKGSWNPFANEYALFRLVEDETIYQSNLLTFHLENALNKCRAELRLKSFQTYKAQLNNFFIWLGKKKLSEITIAEFNSELAKQFLDYLLVEKKRSRTTRNAYLVTLKMLFSKVLEESIIFNNPFGKIKKISHSSVSALQFDKNQIQVLKKYISIKYPQLWMFIEFMYFCLVRPNELRRVRIGDIHGNHLQIRGEIAKNKKTQYVIIPPNLERVIEKHNLRSYPKHFYIFGKGGQPGPNCYSVNRFSTLHRKTLKKLGFSKQHKLYSWKHSGVINMKEQKIDMHEIKMQLRHHSLEVVDEYLKGLGLEDSSISKMDFPDL